VPALSLNLTTIKARFDRRLLDFTTLGTRGPAIFTPFKLAPRNSSGGEKRRRDASPPSSSKTAKHDCEDPSRLKCSVCLETVLPHREPVLLSGCHSHLLCKECADALVQHTCPTCRAGWDRIIPLKESHEFAFLQYQDTLVKCPGDCRTVVAISDLEAHCSKCEMFRCSFCVAMVRLPETIEVRDACNRLRHFLRD